MDVLQDASKDCWRCIVLFSDTHKKTLCSLNQHSTAPTKFVYILQVALLFSRCPENIILSPVQECHVDLILNNYHIWGDNFKPVIRTIVRYNQSMGVFCDGKLVAHTLENWNGAIGIVFTNSEYRNRGLAYLAATQLARRMALDGTDLHLVIRPNNFPSIELFSRKLGFGQPVCKQSCFYKKS
jgi:hypothetical protein